MPNIKIIFQVFLFAFVITIFSSDLAKAFPCGPGETNTSNGCVCMNPDACGGGGLNPTGGGSGGSSGSGSSGSGGGGVFGSVTAKAQNIFQNMKTLIYVLGGFGLMGFATGAIFGKVQWKWFATLSFGLFMISVGDQIVTYITASAPGSGGTNVKMSTKMGDTFGTNNLINLDMGDSW